MTSQKKSKTNAKTGKTKKSFEKEIAILKAKLPGVLKKVKKGTAVMTQEVEKAFEKMKPGIKLVAKESERQAKIGALKIQILGTTNKINRLLSELGKKLYTLINKKRVEVTDSTVKELTEKIKELEQENKKIGKKLEKI
ncbi:unnamed protein product [marine sediment metagenome]|uniref:Uncharacterized protein n=1 Tax=marine sediment metagenome TaxID=412755 RepID=X0S569_9ZZZZ